MSILKKTIWLEKGKKRNYQGVRSYMELMCRKAQRLLLSYIYETFYILLTERFSFNQFACLNHGT